MLFFPFIKKYRRIILFFLFVSLGTVVGTYGWVDSNGYLRLRDYVADNEGYRIVKTKLIYVGENSDVEGSASVTSNRSKYHPNTQRFQPSFSNGNLGYDDSSWRRNSYVASESKRLNSHSLPKSRTDTGPDSSSGFLSQPIAGSPSSRGIAAFDDTTTPKPSVAFAAPPQAIPINYLSQPDLEFAYDSSNENPAAVVQLKIPYVRYDSSTSSPPASKKFLYPENNDDFSTKAEATKLYVEGNEKRKPYERIGLGNDEEYNGDSTVQNGFRYFLPRHYHEETVSKNGQDRAGSFGYVDPFGIRRVIYYNTSPEKGFVHKKNNRYVGFLSTPYDPKPNL